jgi:hypothetical protein
MTGQDKIDFDYAIGVVMIAGANPGTLQKLKDNTEWDWCVLHVDRTRMAYTACRPDNTLTGRPLFSIVFSYNTTGRKKLKPIEPIEVAFHTGIEHYFCYFKMLAPVSRHAADIQEDDDE